MTDKLKEISFAMSFTPRLVLVTAPTLEQGRLLSRLILEQHLGACVNVVPAIESHYWWEGQLESGGEVLLLIKSSAERFEALRELIALHHSYACPEVVAIHPAEMAPAYRIWWEKNLAGGP